MTTNSSNKKEAPSALPIGLCSSKIIALTVTAPQQDKPMMVCCWRSDSAMYRVFHQPEQLKNDLLNWFNWTDTVIRWGDEQFEQLRPHLDIDQFHLKRNLDLLDACDRASGGRVCRLDDIVRENLGFGRFVHPTDNNNQFQSALDETQILVKLYFHLLVRGRLIMGGDDYDLDPMAYTKVHSVQTKMF